MSSRDADVVVIGAGQAGLSVGHHLRRVGLAPVDDERGPSGSFAILDADAAPGGAWRHRWASLRMSTVNGIHELPGRAVPPADPHAPARDVLPAYFADYERSEGLSVRRPVRVRSVSREDASPDGRLLVETDGEREGWTWRARFVVNATGTWTNPYLPFVRGAERFSGRMLHTSDYVSAEELSGLRVIVVGAGVSAIQHLEEVSRVADAYWVTRSEPRWDDGDFDVAARVAAVAGVAERVRRGLPVGSVVSATGMRWTPWALEARERGVLVRHPMFTEIEEDGVREPDGTFVPADVILWATGFRPAIRHLAPLRLRTPDGGIRVEDARAVDEQRLFLVGYGPSASTIGANRAGRRVANAIARGLSPAFVSGS